MLRSLTVKSSTFAGALGALALAGAWPAQAAERVDCRYYRTDELSPAVPGEGPGPLETMLLPDNDVFRPILADQREPRFYADYRRLHFRGANQLSEGRGDDINVGMVAFGGQFGIWGLGFVGLTAYFAAQGVAVKVPSVPASVFAYLILFFLLGYFIYATLYALVGSMVTTAQEGGQLAMPIIFVLLAGFLLVIPIIRSPNSSFAFWVSMIPFFAPITMLIRIATQTPPLWQIALSLTIGFTTVVLLLWLASRVYRVGMLMYGKRATIPEVLKWIRQP